MGQTSENVCDRYGITRKEQDEFAVESHKRAAAAQAAGKFKEQIVPVPVKVGLITLPLFSSLSNMNKDRRWQDSDHLTRRGNPC
jgi:acetyl-CoA acetyltransferase